MSDSVTGATRAKLPRAQAMQRAPLRRIVEVDEARGGWASETTLMDVLECGHEVESRPGTLRGEGIGKMRRCLLCYRAQEAADVAAHAAR